MSDYETILYVERESVARLMVTALQAHGFSPREITDGGLPGIGAGLTGKGLAIAVPRTIGQSRPTSPMAAPTNTGVQQNGSRHRCFRPRSWIPAFAGKAPKGTPAAPFQPGVTMRVGLVLPPHSAAFSLSQSTMVCGSW